MRARTLTRALSARSYSCTAKAPLVSTTRRTKGSLGPRFRCIANGERGLRSSAVSLSASLDGEASVQDEPEKSGRRRAVVRSPSKADANEDGPVFPSSLNILWEPSDSPPVPQTHLPPPEIYREALSNLLITLAPQTQHRATYPSQAGPLVEPTLALFCPLEGGEYVLDATVRQLAKDVGADVLVIDAVQLAAGEWGVFGKPASAIQLPRNPLQYPYSSDIESRLSSGAREETAEDDEDGPVASMAQHIIMQPASFTVQIPTGSSPLRSARRVSPPSRARRFFDDIIDMTFVSDSHGTGTPASRQTGRPRIIYIRDFGTIAPSASTWYPPFLSAVRERRRGPFSRSASPVLNPTTIIFGVTPPITGSSSSSGSDSQSRRIALWHLMMRNAARSHGVGGLPPSNAPAIQSDSDEWGEGAVADKARERRLRERLRKWELSDSESMHQLLPRFSVTATEVNEGNNGSFMAPFLLMPSQGLPDFVRQRLVGLMSNKDGEEPPSYFRATIIVPQTRSQATEKEHRVGRRREINEVLMRMGVGHIGGELGDMDLISSAAQTESQNEEANAENELDESGPSITDPPAEEQVDSVPLGSDKMLEEWGLQIEPWPAVKDVADRAVGSVMATNPSNSRLSLDPLPVPWSAVRDSWHAQRQARATRRNWVEDTGMKIADEPNESEDSKSDMDHDELVERVKRDPDLNQHEQRLISCIINPAVMPTTFSQVHLPPHTIDSVRTLVSLPLLYPAAFASGVLKQHAMTGALLFGPPGTGKTLVVKALARESGARMMIVKPSDVMDMYVGEGEKLVRAVFSLARRISPCVVFLDEIDSLFGARVSGRESGGTIAHRGVITEFMQEMDGLKTREDGKFLLVIGATNRPFDLDDAVLRRLPRRLLVDLPGELEREEILKIILRDEELASDVDLKGLAKRTESFSGSDLKHLCVAAALDAVKEKVKLPWSVPRSGAVSGADAPHAEPSPDQATSEHPGGGAARADANAGSPGSESLSGEGAVLPPRIIAARHFHKALSEITPTASETLGSLAELRRWSEEFGENGKAGRKRRMWGGRFGFSLAPSQDAAGQPSASPGPAP